MSIFNKFIHIFKSSDPETCPDFDTINIRNYQVPVTTGWVIKVYDGDTITIATQIYNDTNWYKFNIRLYGIDTPEIKGPNSEIAKKIRNNLILLILHKKVRIEILPTNDKYGRLLGNVFIDDLHINNWLLANNMALPYEGGTKPTFSDEWIQNVPTF